MIGQPPNWDPEYLKQADEGENAAFVNSRKMGEFEGISTPNGFGEIPNGACKAQGNEKIYIQSIILLFFRIFQAPPLSKREQNDRHRRSS